MVSGTPTGAPDSACTDMVPGHGGVVPDDLKSARIVPLYKKNNKTDVDSTIKMAFILIIVILAVSVMVSGFPFGATLSDCHDMDPVHGVSPQSTMSTYTIAMSSSNYRCGDSITINLGGANTFRGFLCQARTSVDDGATKVGTMEATNSDSQTTCWGQGVTHTSRSDKSSMTFNWRPAGNHSNVYIVCTWVQDQYTFWVRQPSAMLTYVDGGDCGSGTSRMTSSIYGIMLSVIAFVLYL